MKQQLMEKILALKKQYGEALFEEPKRLMGMVKDLYPFARHEHDLLKVTLPLKLYEQFKGLSVSDYLKCRNDHIHLLEKQEGLNHQYAEEAVDFWMDLVQKDLGYEAVFSRKQSLEEKMIGMHTDERRMQTMTNISVASILHKADCYYNGEGIEENRREALRWYKKAAHMGCVEAMNYVGNIYHMGEGVQRDSELAMKWYMKAASLGSGTAMNYLGNMYYEGRGVYKDDDEARKWYMKAVAKGNYTAMFNLGYIFYEKSLLKKAHSFEEELQTARSGGVEAAYYIAYCYQWGINVLQNYGEALKWYEQLAFRGEQAAMIWLAYMSFNGQGVAKDIQKAREWCEKAIKISE